MTFSTEEIRAWARATALKYLADMPRLLALAEWLLILGYVFGVEKAREHCRHGSDQRRVDSLLVDARAAVKERP